MRSLGADGQTDAVGCNLGYVSDGVQSCVCVGRIPVCDTSAAAGGDSASGAASEIFLLVPLPLPRRVFTNTAGPETSASQVESFLPRAPSCPAFSSSRTTAASLSRSWRKQTDKRDVNSKTKPLFRNWPRNETASSTSYLLLFLLLLLFFLLVMLLDGFQEFIGLFSNQTIKNSFIE